MKVRIVLYALFLVGLFACADVPEPQHPEATELEGIEESQEELQRLRLCAGPRGLTCGANQYCSMRTEGVCPSDKAYGVCAAKPQFCTKEFRPVCGCDGRTYGNACVAAAAGVAVEHSGECLPKGPFCGGIAGIPCEGNAECIDDPSDDCDPKQGGSDCGGICVEKSCEFNPCAATLCPVGTECIVGDDCTASCEKPSCDYNPCAATLCPVGTECIARDCKASCEPSGSPVTCGAATCGPSEYCCNPLSDRCTPIGQFCAL